MRVERGLVGVLLVDDVLGRGFARPQQRVEQAARLVGAHLLPELAEQPLELLLKASLHTAHFQAAHHRSTSTRLMPRRDEHSDHTLSRRSESYRPDEDEARPRLP